MTWNIFKRVAELEQKVKDLMSFSDDGGRIVRLEEKVRQIASLEKRLQEMDRRLNPYAAAPVRSDGQQVFADAEIEKERERKRLYHRAWRAKNKLSEDARDRKNAYARAYYARTKGKKK
jgi:hypothetical protein